jgi:hypothetical protein
VVGEGMGSGGWVGLGCVAGWVGLGCRLGWVGLQVGDIQQLLPMGVVQGARWLLWMWGGGSVLCGGCAGRGTGDSCCEDALWVACGLGMCMCVAGCGWAVPWFSVRPGGMEGCVGWEAVGGGGAECLLLWLERCWAGLGWAGCMDEEAGESDRGCCRVFGCVCGWVMMT